ncbi:DUF3419 family protein [Hoeflea prorocentri]|uniref:DUF3419 family protein n=1 Tax=Hoeflea prorocentri TaxID=1922333 RepID=A0A9X3ZGM3_9HYPH|nr:DUF3419 family protein [Hoeflea prorocentri]MCY6379890.1 DUF3419 family protein [Hoeflea prorocentri]MDA5397690.1 DUF3419 family protein [Hoeflea prorocentri]
MSDAIENAGLTASTTRNLANAVYQNRLLSRRGLSERVFALFFTGLVYPQIWEDPDVDMDAMALDKGHRIVTIASGGCNILAYLTRSPAQIDAVDLNASHVALNRMKLTALEHLPSHGDVLRFFGKPDQKHNSAAYDRFIAPHLDGKSRAYWEQRTWRGSRRIAVFNGNFYRTGLLGWCITAGHLVSRLHGVNPAEIMQSRCLREQRRFFDERLAPIFDSPLVRWASSRKASLFGLGIPPAQYDELLASGSDGTMASVLKERVEKLACHFPLRENYFAQQAFSRRYDTSADTSLPAYLEADHYSTIRDGVRNVDIHHCSYTQFLRRKPEKSVDRFVLLDAQDWMRPDQLTELWSEMTRTAASGARIIFRTAGKDSIVDGKIPQALLEQWEYRDQESIACCRRDRSAIYGGFHLYIKRTQ